MSLHVVAIIDIVVDIMVIVIQAICARYACIVCREFLHILGKLVAVVNVHAILID